MKYFYPIVLILHCCFLQAQNDGFFPPPDNPPQLRATKTQSKILIDGILDESDWNNAQAISQFYRIEPRQGGKHKYRSTVKVLFDNKYIYFGVFAQDSLNILILLLWLVLPLSVLIFKAKNI